MQETSLGQVVVWVAIAVVAVGGYVGLWRQGQQVARLRATVMRLEERLDTPPPPEAPHATPTSTPSADLFADLGSGDALKQYAAARALKSAGELAVPGLLEVAATGNSRARLTALVILGDLESPMSLAGLRELAGADHETEVRAGALGVLARMRDEEAGPLFVSAAGSADREVRVAGVVGLRRVAAYESLGVVLACAADADPTVRREASKAVAMWLREDRDRFVAAVRGLPSPARFQACRVLGGDRSEAAAEILRRFLDDPDERVVLAAAKVLQVRGDSTGRARAEEIVAATDDQDILRLANQVLEQFDNK